MRRFILWMMLFSTQGFSARLFYDNDERLLWVLPSDYAEVGHMVDSFVLEDDGQLSRVVSPFDKQILHRATYKFTLRNRLVLQKNASLQVMLNQQYLQKIKLNSLGQLDNPFKNTPQCLGDKVVCLGFLEPFSELLFSISLPAMDQSFFQYSSGNLEELSKGFSQGFQAPGLLTFDGVTQRLVHLEFDKDKGEVRVKSLDSGKTKTEAITYKFDRNFVDVKFPNVNPHEKFNRFPVIVRNYDDQSKMVQEQMVMLARSIQGSWTIESKLDLDSYQVSEFLGNGSQTEYKSYRSRSTLFLTRGGEKDLKRDLVLNPSNDWFTLHQYDLDGARSPQKIFECSKPGTYREDLRPYGHFFECDGHLFQGLETGLKNWTKGMKNIRRAYVFEKDGVLELAYISHDYRLCAQGSCQPLSFDVEPELSFEAVWEYRGEICAYSGVTQKSYCLRNDGWKVTSFTKTQLSRFLAANEPRSIFTTKYGKIKNQSGWQLIRNKKRVPLSIYLSQLKGGAERMIQYDPNHVLTLAQSGSWFKFDGKEVTRFKMQKFYNKGVRERPDFTVDGSRSSFVTETHPIKTSKGFWVNTSLGRVVSYRSLEQIEKESENSDPNQLVDALRVGDQIYVATENQIFRCQKNAKNVLDEKLFFPRRNKCTSVWRGFQFEMVHGSLAEYLKVKPPRRKFKYQKKTHKIYQIFPNKEAVNLMWKNTHLVDLGVRKVTNGFLLLEHGGAIELNAPSPHWVKVD